MSGLLDAPARRVAAAAALRFVNAERERLGIGPPLDELPPPVGEASGFRCPLAVALGVDHEESIVEYVAEGHILLRAGGRIDLPPLVEAWVADHDRRVSS